MTEIESLRAEVAALRKEVGQLRDRLFFDSAKPMAPAVYPQWPAQPLPTPWHRDLWPCRRAHRRATNL